MRRFFQVETISRGKRRVGYEFLQFSPSPRRRSTTTTHLLYFYQNLQQNGETVAVRNKGLTPPDLSNSTTNLTGLK